MTSTGVNRPTNVKQKEQDVNQKLQFYGIYTDASSINQELALAPRLYNELDTDVDFLIAAFANGKVPSNQQIDVALNTALASKALTSPSKKLSEEGRDLVADLRNVIEQAKYLVLTKNDGNLLQDFVWQTSQVTGGDAQKPGAPIDKDTARQHGNKALEGLRTLGTLIISNGQFRKLLSDVTVLLRDIAGDAAQNVANKVNPSEEQLSQIDKPAEDNTWHDVPDLSTGNIKSQIKSQKDKQKPVSGQDLQNAAGNATQSAHPTGSRDPADAADLAARDQQQGSSSGLDAKSGAKAGAQTLRGQASENVPDETKDRARNTTGQAKEYLSDKMPQERRDQTIWRLKKMIVEIQGHPDYYNAIETLLNLAETYGGHSKNIARQGAGSVDGAHSDDSLRIAEADLRTLIERFANSTSLDDLFDSVNTIYRDADRDPDLKNWFKQVDTYIRKCLKEQGFILEDAATEEYNKLYDRGNYLLRDRYRAHTDHVIDEIKYFGNQFDADPQNKRFGQAVQKLFTDLGNDENGKPTFKKHLIKDLTGVILPGIFESVRYVPIPRIEYSDPTMDAIVENLVIESDNLAPNVFELGSDNYFRWGRKHISNKNNNKVMLSVSGIQMDLKDVSYYVNKKTGFPSIKDKGVADIFMGGQGFSFKVKLATADKTDTQHFFKIEKVDVDVKHLNIKLKQSKHKLLFSVFKPLLFKVIRPAIQKVLEKQIRDQVHQLDALAYEIHKEAERAGKEVQNDPENAPNIYSRYASAAQKKVMEGKQKGQEVAQDKKVNVAVTQHDSIFKDIKLPGGISTKATEYKELAAKGNKWESPVFSIGSAKESTGVPKVSPISRKSRHGVTNGSTSAANGGYGATNGSAGFTNQVDQAFGSSGKGDYSLKNATGANADTTGAHAGTSGLDGTIDSGLDGAPTGPSSGKTLLGAHNPVLTGSA
ncbi:MAG: hypothetical protein M1819_005132 [Sarea resinae]|nr:MAG: hypothetical protein M1819_005132 [Sarea resinae]